MSRTSSLYRLQIADTELDRTHARLREIDDVLQDDLAVAGARQAAGQAAAQLRAGQAAAAEAEHVVAAARAKMAETEQALYGGTVRNPKELQDLQSEAESLRRYLSTLEDRQLEAMLAMEQREHEHAAAVAALELAEAAQSGRRAQAVRERQELTARAERLAAEREVAMTSVAAADLDLYSRLRESTGGSPLAVLQDGSCGACGLTLAASILQSVRGGADLVRCKQCGRILYAG